MGFPIRPEGLEKFGGVFSCSQHLGTFLEFNGGKQRSETSLQYAEQFHATRTDAPKIAFNNPFERHLWIS